jgi:hypothetical protein
MIIDGIILAVILAYLRGGSFKGFEKVELRGSWIIVSLFMVQLVLMTLSNRLPVIGNYMYIWINLFTVGFIFMAWLNRKLPGFYLILLGMALNLLVMLLNGGKMPVSYEAAKLVNPETASLIKQGYKHVLMTEDTPLWFFGDIIPLVDPYPHNIVISLGDVLLNVGGFVFVWTTMFIVRRERKETVNSEVL